MIAEHIQQAIAALLSTDKGATDEERTAVMAAASGQWRALTIVEVARRLGCERPKVYKLIRDGWLPTTPDGKVTELTLSRYLTVMAADAKAMGAA
jgi:excisionase family DNA binding protein